MLEKFKTLIKTDELFYAAVIILIALASFGLGRASVGERVIEAVEPDTAAETTVLADEETETKAEHEQATNAAGAYVGSKNSDKYHLPWCSGAQRIKDENKVWFESKEEAKEAGYTPAGNCKGI